MVSAASHEEGNSYVAAVAASTDISVGDDVEDDNDDAQFVVVSAAVSLVS